MLNKTNMLDLKGLSRAQALVALYNASIPQRMGFIHYDPTPMTVQEATELLAESKYVDYYKGRVMKLDFGKDEINTLFYDCDNGPGSAQQAIDNAAAGNTEAITKKHKEGVLGSVVSLLGM